MAGTQEPVAVLGIGAMGHGMAASALRAGIPTIVWNRTPAATRDLAGLGAQVAATAADAARGAATVVTMVSDTDAVIAIAAEQGMLAALVPGAVWVQMSTIGVAGIQRVAAMVAAERADVVLLDARCRGAGTCRAGPVDDLRLGAPAGPAAGGPSVCGVGQRTVWVVGWGLGRG
jgi:3-hydroxyisobutyrate dehydrogenase